MPSPFPGMDPYLENPAFWPDFHAHFVTYCCDALGDQLPDNYEVRIDERRNVVERAPPITKAIRPDIAITQRSSSPTEKEVAAGVATLEPVTIPLVLREVIRDTRIEILHRPERTLVTILELLSPSNKEEPGRGLYLAKRDGLFYHPVHLVELDLLLGGRGLPLRDPLPPGDYYALISRADRRPLCEVYAWTMRQPLPTIPIPLKAPDPDLPFDLGQVFATAYERGRYARSLNYQDPPPIPVPEDARAWIRERSAPASLPHS
ncbi:MAG: DUF4058 family protein [Planctomycetes bacterium]|nr:DUF4058 family protein [Planctomycetota bacterium]